jgi:hypothetical protein
MITNASSYVSNLTLHEDLKIPYVREVISEKYANWKHTPTLYFTRYWILGDQDD